MANKYGKLTMEDFYFYKEEYLHLVKLFIKTLETFNYETFKKDENEVFGNPTLEEIYKFVIKFRGLDADRYKEGGEIYKIMTELRKEEQVKESIEQGMRSLERIKPLSQKYIFIKNHISKSIGGEETVIPKGTILKQIEIGQWKAYYPNEQTEILSPNSFMQTGIIFNTELVEPI